MYIIGKNNLKTMISKRGVGIDHSNESKETRWKSLATLIVND